ncbi:MAG: hypothetical protein ACXVSL_22935 [Solirubrobacteraceae bacterium]
MTAILTLAPVAISGLRHLAAARATSHRALRVGAAAGVALSAGLVPLLKWRLRRRH